jgi:hypothetical protein
VKQKILGVPYSIRYRKTAEKLDDGKLRVGSTDHFKQQMTIVRNAKEYMDNTYWHEAVHVFDNLLCIKDNGESLTESEVERLGYAISTHLREIKK